LSNIKQDVFYYCYLTFKLDKLHVKLKKEPLIKMLPFRQREKKEEEKIINILVSFLTCVCLLILLLELQSITLLFLLFILKQEMRWYIII